MLQSGPTSAKTNSCVNRRAAYHTVELRWFAGQCEHAGLDIGPACKIDKRAFVCFFFWHVLIQRTQRVSHTHSIHRLVCSDSKCKRKDAYYIRLRAFSWGVAWLVDRPRDEESDGVALGQVQSRKPRRTNVPSIIFRACLLAHLTYLR